AQGQRPVGTKKQRGPGEPVERLPESLALSLFRAGGESRIRAECHGNSHLPDVDDASDVHATGARSPGCSRAAIPARKEPDVSKRREAQLRLKEPFPSTTRAARGLEPRAPCPGNSHPGRRFSRSPLQALIRADRASRR